MTLGDSIRGDPVAAIAAVLERQRRAFMADGFPGLATRIDRLDRLAATHLGDPIQFWRIADGNGAQVPSELERPGDTLRLTLPAGLGGGGA